MKSLDSNRVRIHFQESEKDVQTEGKDSKDSPKNPFTAEPAGESKETYDIGPVTGRERKLPAGKFRHYVKRTVDSLSNFYPFYSSSSFIQIMNLNL